MRKLSLILALLVLCSVPASASVWNAIGSEGIIDESSLNLFEFTGARLQFRPGATGTIVARYPVHPHDVTIDLNGHFTLGYAQNGVTVRLIEASFCIPRERILCEIGPTTFPVGEPGFMCTTCNPEDIENMNFQQNAYYFEVTLTRATTTPNPKLLMISMP